LSRIGSGSSSHFSGFGPSVNAEEIYPPDPLGLKAVIEASKGFRASVPILGEPGLRFARQSTSIAKIFPKQR
jgi:hypothetical protein